MLNALLTRGAALAEARKRAALDRLADGARTIGIAAQIERDALILSGARLMRRYVTDPVMRRLGR